MAALSGGLLFVLCAALLTFFSPKGTSINPTTIPTESKPPIAPHGVTKPIQQKIDTIVRLCVAGGEQFTVTSGGAEISLLVFDVKGNLKGDIHVNKSQAEGLVTGINNAITQVAANEVDEVRECLKPVRDMMLDILFLSQATPSPLPPTLEQRGSSAHSPSQNGSSAQQLNPQQIQVIKETAVSICNAVKEAKGQKSDVQVQGDINAKLGGLIGKVADIGGSGKGSLTREEFEGLSRDATATALQGDRDCRERLFNKMFDKLIAAPDTLANRAFPSSSTLPSPLDAEIVASIPNTFVGFAGPHHSVGLHRCAKDRSFIRCWFVIEALEQQADYYQKGIIPPYTKLIDNFLVEHKLVRVYLLNGKGQPQEKLNLSKGDRVWFIAEFDGGSNDITEARIVVGGAALKAHVE